MKAKDARKSAENAVYNRIMTSIKDDVAVGKVFTLLSKSVFPCAELLEKAIKRLETDGFTVAKHDTNIIIHW